MKRKRPPRTVDMLTGAPFVYNKFARVEGWIVPSRSTPHHDTFLHPSRVPWELLHQLNPGRTAYECQAVTSHCRIRANQVADHNKG